MTHWVTTRIAPRIPINCRFAAVEIQSRLLMQAAALFGLLPYFLDS